MDIHVFSTHINTCVQTENFKKKIFVLQTVQHFNM